MCGVRYSVFLCTPIETGLNRNKRILCPSADRMWVDQLTGDVLIVEPMVQRLPEVKPGWFSNFVIVWVSCLYTKEWWFLAVCVKCRCVLLYIELTDPVYIYIQCKLKFYWGVLISIDQMQPCAECNACDTWYSQVIECCIEMPIIASWNYYAETFVIETQSSIQFQFAQQPRQQRTRKSLLYQEINFCSVKVNSCRFF